MNTQVSEIDPDVDRVILIHVLSAEALDLAKVSDTVNTIADAVLNLVTDLNMFVVPSVNEHCIQVDKSDVEKGVDSDNAANELCDLVEDIVERVPYLRVLVSMLTPRFDLQVSSLKSFPHFSSDFFYVHFHKCDMFEIPKTVLNHRRQNFTRRTTLNYECIRSHSFTLTLRVVQRRRREWVTRTTSGR